MSQERHNNEKEWQMKLSEMESAPVELIFDKSSAWNKLHNRLHHKSKNRKSSWYFLAAACVIAVLCLPFIVEKSRVKPTAVPEAKLPPEKQLPFAVNPDSFSISKNTKVKRIPLQEGEVKRFSRITPGEISKDIASNISDNDYFDSTQIVESNLPQVTVNTQQPVDTSTAVAVQLPSLNKKLKVVHINEFEAAKSQEPSYATLKLNSSLIEQNKYKNRRKSRSSNLFLSNNTTDDLVKIRLSPSN